MQRRMCQPDVGPFELRLLRSLVSWRHLRFVALCVVRIMGRVRGTLLRPFDRSSALWVMRSVLACTIVCLGTMPVGCWPSFPSDAGASDVLEVSASAPDVVIEAGPCGLRSPESFCPSPPTSVTSGVCVDLTTDDSNCGGCGVACLGGGVCVHGSCLCGAGTSPCSSGTSWRCIDLNHDPFNCGSCANNCGAFQCLGGLCTGCEPGWTLCGGLCVPSTFSWPVACGACGSNCDSGVCIVDSTGRGRQCGL
jgi:hypothetical protein